MNSPLDPASEPTRCSGVSRVLLFLSGIISAGLGILGAFLPILPTTPFLLLGVACFARSSPRAHRWVLAHRVVGPYLAQWNRDHSVPRRAKRKAYVVVGVSFTVSILWVPETWMRLVLALVGVTLLVLLARLRTTHETAAQLSVPGALDLDASRPGTE